MGNTEARQPAAASLDPEQPVPVSNAKAPLLIEDKVTRSSYSDLAESSSVDLNDERLLVPTPDGYFPHLDIWRFMCIAVVVLDHGNGSYSYWNLFFGQNWALQYIFVICGVAFGLSKRSLGGYLFRLVAYAIVGISCNWLAYVITGQDWRHDPWNMVFQFWFIIALIGYSLLLVPLRRYLVSCHDLPKIGDSKVKLTVTRVLGGIGVILGGLACIFALLSVGLTWLTAGFLKGKLQAALSKLGPGLAYWADKDQAGGLLQGLCTALELTVSNFWLAFAIPTVFPSEASVTGWVILINMHTRRLSHWYSGLGEKLMNGLDLMLLGLVCFHLGLKYRRQVGNVAVRYWFVWLSVCGLVWKPGTSGRMDLLMPEDWSMTWRMRFIDTVYMGVWLVAGDRFVDPKIFTEDKCNFINNLGLFLFLVHKAIHIVLPVPWNWVLILSLGPVFYAFSRLRH
mmetsp:Transcript_82582/g.229125  ORF Transcript_82582/g.229125 Transcript_82582/m.229125 type:complete len:453 (+) Transcript_82582:99-1457(+)